MLLSNDANDKAKLYEFTAAAVLSQVDQPYRILLFRAESTHCKFTDRPCVKARRGEMSDLSREEVACKTLTFARLLAHVGLLREALRRDLATAIAAPGCSLTARLKKRTERGGTKRR